MEDYEVVVIGGGPAGLSAGLNACRAHLRTVLLEATAPSGPVATAEKIENYMGFPEGVSGPELIRLFEEQAVRIGLQIREFCPVEKIDIEDGRKRVSTPHGDFSAQALILATGTTWRKMTVEGEGAYAGRGVSYCATCDGAFFEGLDVAVVGGGDTALSDALYLSRMARKVFVIHRRGELRAQKVLQHAALGNPVIEFVWNSVVREVAGGELVEKLILEDTRTGERTALAVNGVFVAIGQSPNVRYLGGLLDRDEAGFIITDEDCETSIPGIFAAGDVRSKALRQISTAVADGAIAAFSADAFLQLSLQGVSRSWAAQATGKGQP
jgi:thioredoxin reductase (NADPH)